MCRIYLILFGILWPGAMLLARNKRLTDSLATKETRALFENLDKLSKRQVLFGHQHATEYGHGWTGDSNRSDVRSVTGSHPAVIGVDVSGLSGLPADLIRKNKAALIANVQDTYRRGGLTTVAWHFSNPVSGGGFYWKDSVSLPAVKYIIPGARDHERYKAILDDLADWASRLKGDSGELIPVIFRPFHEFDGDWFWWGRAHCTPEEFRTLWRFTVSYLRDSADVHNFIYAFSPDAKFSTEQQYLERYPGDNWVDMLGMDNYADMGREGHYDLNAAAAKLRIVSQCARQRGKLAAFTETGLESVSDAHWWTRVLLKVIKSKGIRIAYVLVWRNDPVSRTHYYAPYPGQVSAPDFIRFYKDRHTLFENDLQGLYRYP